MQERGQRRERLPRGLGEIDLINPPQSPFFKGGGVFDETLFFQRGTLFLTKSLKVLKHPDRCRIAVV
jgi:hypothetical protein